MPLGKPECVIENLDRWGVDEILVLCIDRSASSLGPNFKLLKNIARLGLNTPLIFGGGINSVKNGIDAIQLGADRICIDSMLQDHLEEAEELTKHLGAQALIGVLPLSISDNDLKHLDHRQKLNSKISNEHLNEIAHVVSEILIIDWMHEGEKEGFDARLITDFPMNHVPLIAFGGISEHEQMHSLLALNNVSAVAVGNSLNYKEHSVQKLKDNLMHTSLRQSDYESKHTLLNDV